jgi:hypothetical protein
MVSWSGPGSAEDERVWPTLPLANRIADLANLFFIGSLVVGVVATVLIVWMANVKEGHWERARLDSDERIAHLNNAAAKLSAEAQIARAEIAKANERAADANSRASVADARALEAQLALERFKAPRKLLDDQQMRISEKLKRFSGQQFILSVSTDQDSLKLVRVLASVLKNAGWVLQPSSSGVLLPDIPAGISAAVEEGVRVQIAPQKSSDDNFVRIASAVAIALTLEGIEANVTQNLELNATPDAIQIRVGTKPR